MPTKWPANWRGHATRWRACIQEFPAGDAFADELAVFLKRWPDESAFYDSLFATDVKYTDNLGSQLYGLGSQAHDTRSKWKTPFPFFRP